MDFRKALIKIVQIKSFCAKASVMWKELLNVENVTQHRVGRNT